MSVAGKVTVDLETRTAGWTKGLEGGGRDLKQFVGNAERMFKNLGGLGSGLKDALAHPISSNWGAPLVAGIGTIGKLATGAGDIAYALRTGESAAAAFGKVVDGIPIVGQFKQAGQAIRELFTGEQAARVEREKSAAALQRSVDAYRQMALSASELGKYGHELAQIQAENAKNAELSKLGNEHSALNHDVMKREEQFGNWAHKVPGLGATDAEKAELARDKALLKQIEAQQNLVRSQGAQKQKDLAADAAQEQLEFVRGHENNIDAVKASMDEKSLRRQGKALESAIVGIKAEAAAREKALEAELDEHKLRGLSPDDRDKRIAANYAEREQLEKNTAAAVDALQEEDGRRKAELARDNEDKLREIRATGKIEQLKITDEQINAENEKHGIAARSHLAEAAAVEEQFRKQVSSLEKNYREENKKDKADYNDPVLQAQLAAAAEERKQKLGALDQKSGLETTKNENDLLKEKRKLWEEVGTEADKYAAHLDDIEEQYQKLGDAALRDKQIEALDKKTFEDLKKQNPDHDPTINLYGRTLDFDYVPKGNTSTQLAQQQLDALKKANDDNDQEKQDRKVMFDYYRNQTTVVPQEITI